LTAQFTLVEQGGLRAVESGSLRCARESEAVGLLSITPDAAGKSGWAGGFALKGLIPITWQEPSKG
jgi:predicted dinucleotide-binding enzyme